MHVGASGPDFNRFDIAFFTKDEAVRQLVTP